MWILLISASSEEMDHGLVSSNKSYGTEQNRRKKNNIKKKIKETKKKKGTKLV